MPWILLHQPWQMDLPSIKHRCLEYNYTKLGRWTSLQSSIDALNTTTPNLADGPPNQWSIDALNIATPNLANGPPINIAYMPWILLHQSLQMDFPSFKHRWLEYHYTKPGRWTPQPMKHRCLEYCYTNLCRWTSLQSGIDGLNTTTPNLAVGSPFNQA